MKRFSIKDLPSKYSNAEYNLKQMTTNDLKHWKEQGCLDDEETGILWIAKDNEIDYLYIGNKCPDSADDIVVTGVKLAIYFDGDDLMVKAKNDVDIEYISNAIDEIVEMWYDETNKVYDVVSFEIGKKYRLSNNSVYECIDNKDYKFKSIDGNNRVLEGTSTLKNKAELVTIDFGNNHFLYVSANDIARPIDFKVGTVYKYGRLNQKVTKVNNCYVWIDDVRYSKSFNEENYCYEAYGNHEHFSAISFVTVEEYNKFNEMFTEPTETEPEKIENNPSKSTEIEDLPREELEDIIKEDIVKFNEFAVNKIKEYSPEEWELKVYTSPTYNYRVDEIFAYSEYIQVYVAIYGIYQLAYLIQSCIDYRTTEVFNYDIDDECVYVWGGFDKEETSKTTEDTKFVDETIYEEKERFVRISLKSLLFDIDKNILDVYYQHDNATNEEFVTILYANCNKDMLNEKEQEKICVTGDSLIAIVNDVTKRLLH